MEIRTTGREVIDDIFAGQPWWKVSAADVQRWAKAHGWRTEASTGCDAWIGLDWDGRSDIRMRTHTIKGTDVADLLAEVGRGISERGIKVERLPDATSVRHCYTDTDDDFAAPEFVAIDIDLGEVIVPVSINEYALRSLGPFDADYVAEGMLEMIAGADRIRTKLAKREALLRNAFVRAARAGAMSPVWLRMEPWDFNGLRTGLWDSSYQVVALTLDEDLSWTMSGILGVERKRDLRTRLGVFRVDQRRRAERRRLIARSNSAGLFTEVALALAVERGFEPREVLTYLRTSRLAGRWGGMTVGDEKVREALILTEGTVQARIEFPGGQYSSGILTLRGGYPETLATGALGRRFAAYVDHPALRASRVVVDEVEQSERALELRHSVRLLTVEDAERIVRMRAQLSPGRKPHEYPTR